MNNTDNKKNPVKPKPTNCLLTVLHNGFTKQRDLDMKKALQISQKIGTIKLTPYEYVFRFKFSYKLAYNNIVQHQTRTRLRHHGISDAIYAMRENTSITVMSFVCLSLQPSK